MHPFLFDWVINGHHIKPPTYGVLLAVAFSTAYFTSLRRAIKLGDNPKHVENLFLIVVACSIVGARMFHVLFEDPKYYIENPIKILAIWEGGYTLYGAIIFCIFGMFLYTYRKQVPLLEFLDIATPATALGICIGRIGCFFAGCCWGVKTNLPWAITYTHPEAFTFLKNTPIHPTQLYESIGALGVYLYTNWLFKHRRYEGQILFNGLLSYAVLRFLVEIFRGDEYRGFVFGGLLSYSQFVSLLILPIVTFGMWANRNSKPGLNQP